MRKFMYYFLQIFIMLVLLVGIGASILYFWQNQISAWIVSSNTPTVTRAEVKRNERKQGVYDFESVSNLTPSEVAKANWYKNPDNLAVVGKIIMPRIKMNLPISLGTTNENLAFSAGTMKPDQTMGQNNYALAGHHMLTNDVLFGPLYAAKVGDAIYLSDYQYVYEYRLFIKKYIAATQVDIIDDVPNQKILTLVTCDDTGDGRLAVRANYVGKKLMKDSSNTIRKQFKQQSNNSGGTS